MGLFFSRMNTKEKIELRARANGAVRAFFAERGYLEVETPRFVLSPDIEPTLSHLETAVTDMTGKVYKGALITSPEYALKKIVSPETPRIFELARVFRNREPLDRWHNPEFTMLEWYQLGTGLSEGMRETTALIDHMMRTVSGASAVRVGGTFMCTAPDRWETVSVETLFQRHAGIPSLANPMRETYQSALRAHGLHWEETDTISDLFQRVFINLVQPHLDAADHPIIVAYYPRHEATLARINDRGFAERFEVYIGGVELCNGYGELTDPAEQRKRFVEEQRERQRLGKTLFPIDEELLRALQKIHEPLFGNAIGLDRVIMLAAGLSSIDDVLLFSTRRLLPPNDSP